MSSPGPRHETAAHRAERALEKEARRVYRRYAVEIVETFTLCPYARRARQESRTREVVILGAAPDDGELEAAVEHLNEDEGVEIGLVLLPRVDLDPRDFEHRVQALRRTHQARHGGALVALEAFHPQADADASSARLLIPFLRRTPDPTIQVARLSVLERLRRGRAGGTGLVDLDALEAALADPSSKVDELLAAPETLHERIAENNLATFRGPEGDRMCSVLDAIFDDRDRSYEAIDGLQPRPPTWGPSRQEGPSRQG